MGQTAKCHEPLTKGRVVHGPVAVKRCEACHEQRDPKLHRFEPIGSQSKLCNSCHEIAHLPIRHKPLEDGQCTACHNPHHSKHRRLLIAKTSAGLCAKCHEEEKSPDKKFVHTPIKTGDCAGCHNAHSSVKANLLSRSGTNLCLECHADMGPKTGESRHWHKPVKDDCANCHASHASEFPFQLKVDPSKLCLDCHKEMHVTGDRHAAMTTEKGCLSCHDPHVSEHPKLLKKTLKSVCLDCHDKPQLRKDDSLVLAVGQQIERAKFVHGPIREGNCGGCHDPHGALEKRLLRGDYPQKFYATFKQETYSLCFSCHEAKVFTTEKTKVLTEFRNGDVNLHFLHVNDGKKGRTCGTCHATHSSDQPKLMAKSAPFGNWDIPLEFKKLERGGSCAPGCHKARTYNIDKPVIYAIPPAKKNGEVEEAGNGTDKGKGKGKGKGKQLEPRPTPTTEKRPGK